MCVLQELEQYAVPLIAAGFGDDVDDSASRPAVLRVVHGGLHFDLTGGFHLRHIGDLACAGKVRNAVDEHLVTGRLTAADGDGRRARDVERPEALSRGRNSDSGRRPGVREYVAT